MYKWSLPARPHVRAWAPEFNLGAESVSALVVSIETWCKDAVYYTFSTRTKHPVLTRPLSYLWNPLSAPQILELRIELLIKLGPDALKQGNLTLFETPRYGITNTWVDLSRHGLSFRAAHLHMGMGLVSSSDGWEMIRPRLNGTGRASTNYLQDGEWHHLPARIALGGV